MRRRKGQLSQVSSTIKPILRQVAASQRETHPELWARWIDIVGPDLATRAIPIRLRGRTLLVAVGTSAWMQELTYLKPTILKKIHQEIGPSIVRDIHLRLDPSVAVSPTGRPDPQEVAVPMAQIPHDIARAIEAISNEELRIAITGAVGAQLGRDGSKR